MALQTIHTAVIDPVGDSDFVSDTEAGSDMPGGQLLALRFDPDSFTAAEGKIRLVLALRRLSDRIESGNFTWPAPDDV